jgi:hypothetical protein
MDSQFRTRHLACSYGPGETPVQRPNLSGYCYIRIAPARHCGSDGCAVNKVIKRKFEGLTGW